MNLIQNIKILIDNIKNISNKKTYKSNIINNKEIKTLLIELYGIEDVSKSLVLFLSGIYSIPLCRNHGCNNHVNISATGPGLFCSKSCSSKYNFKNNSEKRKKTNLDKYGTENPQSNLEVIAKRINTLKEKYGRGVSDKSLEKIKERTSEFIRKGKITIKEKYNVNNSINIPGVLEKRHKSNLEKYGTNNFTVKANPIELLTIPGITILSILGASEEDKKIYPHKNNIIQFKCMCGNEESHPYQTYKYRIRNFNTPCSLCSNIKSNISNKEKNLKDFLEEFALIQTNLRNIIPPKELDFFIPDKKIAIEFNGIYWHTEEKGKDKNYHLSKTLLCKNNDVELIHIFEDEWDLKKDIVKSRLKSKLGINNKIYARKTKVVEISSNDAKEFCDLNHIQGGVFSKINLGLELDNEIVAVMSFSKPNITRGKSKDNYDYELIRFCNKLDTNVIGGASKLFKYFIKKYNPQTIISYSDNRWGNGSLYNILGFEFNKNTSPNYWYVKNGHRYHRYNFTKHKLIEKGYNKNKSESQIMTELGYGKIWDCGHAKWVWKK